MQLIIDTADTKISIKNKSFYLEKGDIHRQINPKRVSSIAITVNCLLNTSVIKLAANHQIPIYIFNNFGTLQARMYSPYFNNIAILRRKQLLFYDSPEANNWIIDLLKQKTELQIQNLQKWTNRKPKHKQFTTQNIRQIKKILSGTDKLINQNIDQSRKTLLGIEGSISRLYYKNLSLMLPDDMQFSNRSRRPAKDYFNAALNYMYGMTYSIVEAGVFAKGLDPFLGFMHTDNYLKTSLVFDLIEPIRPLIDRKLVAMIQTGKIKPAHFTKKEQGYWLNKKGKRIIIPDFNKYLYQRIKTKNKIRRLKDIIYGYSNELGNLIMQKINK